jgi:hypothetical protein
MTSRTTDGYTVTTIEQQGDAIDQDIGRLWVRNSCGHGECWTIYTPRTPAQQQAYFRLACTMTSVAFDQWWDSDASLPEETMDQSTTL